MPSSLKPKPVAQKAKPVKLAVPTRRKKFRATHLIGAFVVLCALATAGYFYVQYRDLKAKSNLSTEQKNQAETDDVVTELKKILLISGDEEPTVARVDSPEQLKATNAEFYKDVQAGDYLIVYTKRAIIYRESINQIINLAPIIETPSSSAAQSP